MIRRFLSLLVTVTVLCSCMTVTAYATGDETSWVELLETATVGNMGQNWFNYTTSVTVTVPTPRNMRCTKIDMLIAFTAGMAPTKVQLRYNGSLYNLTIDQIDSSTARIYGDIPDTYYSDMVLVFTRGSTTKCYTEILSCRVSPVSSQFYNATGQVYIDGTYYPLAEHISMGGDLGVHSAQSYLVYVLTDAWTKFDSLTIFGSVSDASISSVRVVLGSQVLPFEVNYIDTEAGGGWQLWNENGYQNGSVITNTGEGYATDTWGRYLYSVTVDLTNVDRTKSSSMLHVTFTGDYDDMFGATFNCQAITGEVSIPDTSGASWWTKFTNFMTGLFQSDTSQSDEFQDSASQQGQQMEDLNEQLQSVTKPPVADVETDLDSYVDPGTVTTVSNKMALLTGDSLIVSMLMITLTVALIAYILFGKR